MTKDLLYIGSKTAKQGFANEKQVAQTFENYAIDITAQQWLITMGYNIPDIEWVKAEIIHGHKADVVVEIKIKLKHASSSENIQVKLITGANFNQIDKRWVDTYQKMWCIPDNIIYILKRFSGEILPTCIHSKDPRRMFIYEFTESEQQDLLDWLNANKTLILADILKGRGQFATEWFLLINKHNRNYPDWGIKPINQVLNYFTQYNFQPTKRGSLHIGTITLQRKGGDGGRHTANMLQFKMKPLDLFKI